MSHNLHSTLIAEIDNVVKRHQSTGESLNVYAEAQRMVTMAAGGNVTVPDVVSALIQHPQAGGIAFELDSVPPCRHV